MSGIRWLVAWLLMMATVTAMALLPGGAGQSPAASAVTLYQVGRLSAAGQEVPTLDLAPRSGLAGTRITASGSGYGECLPPGDSDSGAEDPSASQPPPPTSSSPPPSLPPPGPHAELGPAAGTRPQVLVAPPNGQVTLFWDEVERQPVADLDENAAFTTSFDVPASATPGPHTVVSRCTGTTDPRILASATFTVTTPPQVLVAVPDLVGLPPRDAPAALQRVGLELGRILGSGDVIDGQQPAAGTRVPRGSAVRITLVRSPSPERLVAVPDLINQTVNEARMALAAAGLTLGNYPDGGSRVRGQTPAAGTLVASGTPVTVTVSPAPVPPPVPDRPSGEGLVPPMPPGGGPGTATTAPQPPPTTEHTSSFPVSFPMPDAWSFPWWVLLIAAALVLLGVPGWVLASRTRNEPILAPADVRVVAGTVSYGGATIDKSPADHSSRTVVVRLHPHHDRGAQILEVQDQ